MSSPEKNETISDVLSALERLKSDYSLLLQERNRAVGELSALGEALSDCQRRRVELESALKRIREGESSAYGDATATRLRFLEQEVDSLSKTNTQLESLLFKSLTQEPQAKEKAREFFLREGSLTHRILLLVIEKGSMDIGEIAKATGLGIPTMNQVIGALVKEKAIEIRGSMLTVPGILRLPDFESWRRSPIDKVFDEAEKYCADTRNPDQVVEVLKELKDQIELKAKIRGTIIFEIGKEIQTWKRGMGSQQELRYKIRDWKLRTLQ